jgi:predicted AlkP superfamily pyrophosphatase or phosphodiesterase
MNKITQAAEEALLKRQALPTNYGPNSVRPAYDGLSLTNVPALVYQLLTGITSPDLVPPVNPALLEVESVSHSFQTFLERGPINHVITLLIDALGYEQLNKMLDTDELPTFQQLTRAEDNFFMPITSVYPSTTTTALTTLATGRMPQEHGIMATVTYFAEAGLMVNLIRHSIANDYSAPPISDKVLNPDEIVAVPNMYTALEAQGVKCQTINYYAYSGSSISRFTSANSNLEFINYRTPSGAAVALRNLIEKLPAATSDQKSYTYAYLSTVDETAHRFGPLSPNYAAELSVIDFTLGRELFSHTFGREDVLFLIIADHGQLQVEKDKTVWLNEHPELLQHFRAPVGGERRATYLYLKPSTVSQAQAYCQQHFGEALLALTKDEALQSGIFGSSDYNTNLACYERLGDLVLLPYENWQIRHFMPSEQASLGSLGAHGGLHRSEMLIPFLAVRMK